MFVSSQSFKINIMYGRFFLQYNFKSNVYLWTANNFFFST